MTPWHELKREPPPPTKQAYLCAWRPSNRPNEQWFYEVLTYWPDGTWTDDLENELLDNDFYPIYWAIIEPPTYWANIEPPTLQQRPSAQLSNLMALAEKVKNDLPEESAYSVLINANEFHRGIRDTLSNHAHELSRELRRTDQSALDNKLWHIAQNLHLFATQLNDEFIAASFCTATLARAIATHPTEGQQS